MLKSNPTIPEAFQTSALRGSGTIRDISGFRSRLFAEAPDKTSPGPSLRWPGFQFKNEGCDGALSRAADPG
jgi:hypothetical protein